MSAVTKYIFRNYINVQDLKIHMVKQKNALCFMFNPFV